MVILKNVYNSILDALFPRSSAEIESLSYSPEDAWEKLPKAPATPVANTYAIFAYKDERVSKLIWNIKYKKSAQAVKIGGYALYMQFVGFFETGGDTPSPRATISTESNSLKKNLLSGYRSANALLEGVSPPVSKNPTLHNTLVLPIPITNKRRNERGYNQCELLVDEMKRLDTKNQFMVCKDLLERVHHLSRQTLKNRADRLESAKDIFAINESELKKLLAKNIGIENTTVVVIDDVITTGSTIKEAMGVIKSAGFKNVFGLSLAH